MHFSTQCLVGELHHKLQRSTNFQRVAVFRFAYCLGNCKLCKLTFECEPNQISPGATPCPLVKHKTPRTKSFLCKYFILYPDPKLPLMQSDIGPPAVSAAAANKSGSIGLHQLLAAERLHIFSLHPQQLIGKLFT